MGNCVNKASHAPCSSRSFMEFSEQGICCHSRGQSEVACAVHAHTRTHTHTHIAQLLSHLEVATDISHQKPGKEKEAFSREEGKNIGIGRPDSQQN